ncbi:MAG: hypothetical protein GF333_01355 [Candidatus Omnitrophica bacterium]|nr:hypothetical protein [Candidatus Omnitrophota bacterium]
MRMRAKFISLTCAAAVAAGVVCPLSFPRNLTKTGVRTVLVSLNEWSIEMPREVTAGPTILRVTNTGSLLHNFGIEGPGVQETFLYRLRPGETKTMDLELSPGQYRVYSPAGDRAARGMELLIEVEPQTSIYGGAETQDKE